MKITGNKINYFILICFSLLMLLGFSYTTTPLYDTYSTDSAIFMLIGKSMLNGKKLYVDIWDHKGPMLFFFQALGMIGGKLGLFVLQVILFSVSSIFLYKTAKLMTTERKALLSTLFMILCMMPSVSGGNLCEEYSFPFVVISFYLAMKYICSGEVKHKYIYSVIYGISFAVVALIRINNAVLICASVLAICVVLIKEKQYMEILKNALWLIAGVLIVAVPVGIYFVVNDSLYDMIYATFIFNFKYTAHVGGKTTFIDRRNEIIYITPLIMTVIVTYFSKNKNIFLMSVINTVAVSLVLFMAKSYLHYFYWVYPVALVGTVIATEKFSEKKLLKSATLITMCLYIAFCAIPIKEIQTRIAGLEKYKTEKAEITEAFKDVDKERRIFGYNMTANDILVADFIPCFKYFTLQDWWSKSDEQVRTSINEMLTLETPDYIVVPKSGTENEFLNNFIDLSCEKHSSTSKLDVYTVRK